MAVGGGLPNRFLTVPFDAIPVWYKKDVWLAGYVVVNFTIQFNSTRCKTMGMLATDVDVP